MIYDRRWCDIGRVYMPLVDELSAIWYRWSKRLKVLEITLAYGNDSTDLSKTPISPALTCRV